MSKSELTTKNLVVLGSSYAALEIAHILLTSVIPNLADSSSYKLIIVSPSTSMYWNIAGPRIILDLPKPLGANPTQETVFTDVESGFKAKYGDGKTAGKVQWEFVPAFARKVDPERKIVQFERISGKEDTISLVLTSSAILESLPYDQLIVATGTRPHNESPSSATHPPLPPPPYKHFGTTTQTKAALKQWSSAIAASKTILLAGAGPTGVESAGELAFAYPDKKIYLITPTPDVLPMMLDKVQKIAHTFLKNMKVEIKANAKVTSVVSTTDTASAVKVTLSTGETIPVDLYIPTHHSFIPSTEFLAHTSILDKDNFVTLSTHLNNPTYPTIWAAGDVIAFPGNKNSSAIDGQVFIAAHNIRAALSGKPETMKEYKHGPAAGYAVPVGRSKGVGQLGTWRIWSILVWLLKGRDYMIGGLTKIVNGTGSITGSKLVLK